MMFFLVIIFFKVYYTYIQIASLFDKMASTDIKTLLTQCDKLYVYRICTRKSYDK